MVGTPPKRDSAQRITPAARTAPIRQRYPSYSALFNVNPFFADPQIVILDDAHAAESYIASHWSVRIGRGTELYTAMVALLRRVLSPTDHQKLADDAEDWWDQTWVNKVPTPKFLELIPEIVPLVDAHARDTDEIRYPWSVIRDHLHACHLYVSTGEMLLRPLIPPTETHTPFAGAKQRIYLSATLGASGDLERITGRRSIRRLSVPAGYERQGIGRRFFLFPNRSLDEAASRELTRDLVQRAGRALYLVPSDRAAAGIRAEFEQHLGFRTFTGPDLEHSKQEFVSTDRAAAVVANRYDGIDLAGDECRLLIVDGLSTAVNLQERFLVQRMATLAVLQDRYLTRIVQAFGRCTRADTDYAAVVVLGEELYGHLMKRDQRAFLHPELQAELEFGLRQSEGVQPKDFLENFDIFLAHGAEWQEVDQEIVAFRHGMQQQNSPGTESLRRAVGHEVSYQNALWQGDAERALEHCRAVLAELNSPDLRGYRGLWNYLAGSVAWIAARQGLPQLDSVAREYFRSASGAVPGVRWLHTLQRVGDERPVEEAPESRTLVLLERLEGVLGKLGIMNDHRFAQEERFILQHLNGTDSRTFEQAHERLGRLLGFDAGNRETAGAPDPWWIVDENLCVIFEDHSEANPASVLGVNKARQAASHPAWARERLPISGTATIIPVLVSPIEAIDPEAAPHLGEVRFWNLGAFRRWATEALSVIRELRRTFPGPGDLAWRAEAAERYSRSAMDPAGLLRLLDQQRAADLPVRSASGSAESE